VLAIVLFVGLIVWDETTWHRSDGIPISPRWSIALELRSMGTPFAEYYRRVRRFQVDGRDTSHGEPVELTPDTGGGLPICLYRITTPSGALFLEVLDPFERFFVKLDPFARVAAVPVGSTREFLGEFLEASPLMFMPGSGVCRHDRTE
jgi:hypothetical protein